MKDVDFSAEKELAKDFLSNFPDSNGEPKYMRILQEVANRKFRAIEIDIEDLFSYTELDEEFRNRVQENTRRYIGVFADGIDELMPEPTEAFTDDDHDILMTQSSDDGPENMDGPDPRQKMPPEIKRYFEVYIRASSSGKLKPYAIREVKAPHIGQLVRSLLFCISTMFMILLPSSIIKPENVGLTVSYGLSLNGVLFWGHIF